MDKLNVHPRCPRETRAMRQQQPKKKKKQIKVVYISNPMRFKASASEFKGLVQQFTGRDADVAELSKFAGLDSYHDEPPASADRVSFSTDDDSGSDQKHQHHQPEAPYKCAAAAPPPPPPLDEFDEVLSPQVLENIFSFLPSSLYYEPPPPIMQ